MRTVTVLLLMLLVLTPTSVLAQTEKPTTSELTLTTWEKLDEQRVLQASVKGKIQKFNAEVGQKLRETQEIKQFSKPYEVEFQRWNQQVQHKPDREFYNIDRELLKIPLILKH